MRPDVYNSGHLDISFDEMTFTEDHTEELSSVAWTHKKPAQSWKNCMTESVETTPEHEHSP